MTEKRISFLESVKTKFSGWFRVLKAWVVKNKLKSILFIALPIIILSSLIFIKPVRYAALNTFFSEDLTLTFLNEDTTLPLAFVDITLENGTVVTTDENGVAIFYGVDFGEHTITINDEGYFPFSGSFTVDLGGGDYSLTITPIEVLEETATEVNTPKEEPEEVVEEDTTEAVVELDFANTKHVFLAKDLEGYVGVYSSNLDGSDFRVILSTGFYELKTPLLYTSPDNKYSIFISTRSGQTGFNSTFLYELYGIDHSTGKATAIEDKRNRLDFVGWYRNEALQQDEAIYVSSDRRRAVDPADDYDVVKKVILSSMREYKLLAPLSIEDIAKIDNLLLFIDRNSLAASCTNEPMFTTTSGLTWFYSGVRCDGKIYHDTPTSMYLSFGDVIYGGISGSFFFDYELLKERWETDFETWSGGYFGEIELKSLEKLPDNLREDYPGILSADGQSWFWPDERDGEDVLIIADPDGSNETIIDFDLDITRVITSANENNVIVEADGARYVLNLITEKATKIIDAFTEGDYWY